MAFVGGEFGFGEIVGCAGGVLWGRSGFSKTVSAVAEYC